MSPSQLRQHAENRFVTANKQEWCDKAVTLLREAADVIERLDQAGGECQAVYLKVANERNALLQPCIDLVAFLDKNPPMGESLWCVHQIREAVSAVVKKQMAVVQQCEVKA